jgi:RNA polymerase sigma-70 factor, ECF subfamily
MVGLDSRGRKSAVAAGRFDFSGYLEPRRYDYFIGEQKLRSHQVFRIGAGQMPDWKRLVDEHAVRVFRVAVRILGCIEDAEDVSQDVFTEAFRLQEQHPVQNWTGLFVRLATLRSLDRLRRLRESQPLREGDRISTAGPFEAAVANELAARLRSEIGELPEQQAAVFTLFHFEHLTRDEISASLGISPEAVSTALYKARQRLQTKLAFLQHGESR